MVSKNKMGFKIDTNKKIENEKKNMKEMQRGP